MRKASTWREVKKWGSSCTEIRTRWPGRRPAFPYVRLVPDHPVVIYLVLQRGPRAGTIVRCAAVRLSRTASHDPSEHPSRHVMTRCTLSRGASHTGRLGSIALFEHSPLLFQHSSACCCCRERLSQRHATPEESPRSIDGGGPVSAVRSRSESATRSGAAARQGSGSPPQQRSRSDDDV